MDKRNTKIIKERRLPLKGNMNCKVGDQVSNDTIVASTFIPGNIHMINVVNQLNIEPQSIKDYLTVKIDGKVKKDDIIAKLIINYDENFLSEHDLLASQSINKINIISRILKSINYLIWGDV